MKDYLMLLAKYNAHANRQLYGIVAELPEADLKKEVGSYFGSVFGLLNHLYRSDCGWLLRIRDNLKAYPVLDSTLLADPVPTGGEPMFNDFATFNEKRPELDALIELFLVELPPDDFAESFTFKLRSGGDKTLALWQALAHMFNHETHHRGALAQALDAMGVTNDYGSLMTIL